MKSRVFNQDDIVALIGKVLEYGINIFMFPAIQNRSINLLRKLSFFFNKFIKLLKG